MVKSRTTCFGRTRNTRLAIASIPATKPHADAANDIPSDATPVTYDAAIDAIPGPIDADDDAAVNAATGERDAAYAIDAPVTVDGASSGIKSILILMIGR